MDFPLAILSNPEVALAGLFTPVLIKFIIDQAIGPPQSRVIAHQCREKARTLPNYRSTLFCSPQGEFAVKNSDTSFCHFLSQAPDASFFGKAITMAFGRKIGIEYTGHIDSKTYVNPDRIGVLVGDCLTQKLEKATKNLPQKDSQLIRKFVKIFATIIDKRHEQFDFEKMSPFFKFLNTLKIHHVARKELNAVLGSGGVVLDKSTFGYPVLKMDFTQKYSQKKLEQMVGTILQEYDRSHPQTHLQQQRTAAGPIHKQK